MFLSVLKSDTMEAAERLVGEQDSSKCRYYWDPDRTVGKALTRPLDIPNLAWDVYLLYEPGAQWNLDAPPLPTEWGHQLAGADKSRFRARQVKEWLRAEVTRRTGGEDRFVAPRVAPGDQGVFSFSVDEIKPLPELILEDILKSVHSGGGSADSHDEIIRRFSERIREYGDRVPRAVRLPDGAIPIVDEVDCPPPSRDR